MSRSLIKSVYGFLAAIAALGFVLLLYGRTVPAYTDFDSAREMKGPDACDVNGVVDGWHEQLSALETIRYPLMQGGISLVLAAITLSAILIAYWCREREQLRSPSSLWTFFGLGIGVVGLSWFSQMHSLVLDQERGVFPWCADSISIPMMGLSISYAVFFVICLLVGAVLSLRFVDLPYPLFAWRRDRSASSIAISIPFALIALVIAFLGIDGATNSSFSGTPAAIVALYLVEATRSGLVCSLKTIAAS